MILQPLSHEDISIEFTVNKILVLPNHENFENVIGKVFWSAKLSHGEAEIKSGGETNLFILNITDFKPIDQLTQVEIIQFVIDSQGGENWLKHYKQMHGQILADLINELSMVEYSVPQN